MSLSFFVLIFFLVFNWSKKLRKTVIRQPVERLLYFSSCFLYGGPVILVPFSFFFVSNNAVVLYTNYEIRQRGRRKRWVTADSFAHLIIHSLPLTHFTLSDEVSVLSQIPRCLFTKRKKGKRIDKPVTVQLRRRRKRENELNF